MASEIDGSPPCERTQLEQKSEAHRDEHTTHKFLWLQQKLHSTDRMAPAGACNFFLGPLHRALHTSDTKFRVPWHLDALVIGIS